MDIKEYMRPNVLEKYSFLWSEARLIIAAVALLLGGVPPVTLVLFFIPGLMGLLLLLSWVISGAASAYLAYRWYTGHQMLFGKKDKLDMAAFAVSVISGLNLGIVGIFGTNIGMSITSNYIVFVVTALVYLGAAWHLYRRWTASGKKLFGFTMLDGV